MNLAKHCRSFPAFLVLLAAHAVFAQSVTEFGAGISGGARPLAIVTGADGNLWFTESGLDRIGRITPSGVVTEFAAGISSGASPSGITLGPDGNGWFTERGTGRIGRITPSGGVTEFSEGMPPGSQPFAIASASDGFLWFTDRASNRIGRIAPNGTVDVFASGSADLRPFEITRGPDGAAWFSQHHAPNARPLNPTSIARIDPSGAVTQFLAGISENDAITTGPNADLWSSRSGLGVGSAGAQRMTTSGQVTTFDTGLASSPFGSGITLGPDGNLWMADFGQFGLSGASRDRLVRVTPAGKVTVFPFGKHGQPLDIAASPDGTMWLTRLGANRLLRVAPSGSIAEFSAGIRPIDFALSIMAGPQGNMWFTQTGGRIGRVAADGSSQMFAIPGAQQLQDIVAGPDGNLWFTDTGANTIGRLRPNGDVASFASLTPESLPRGITAGPDGSLWFTMLKDRIGRITTAGVITEFSNGITPGATPYFIAAGPDGNLWFTEKTAVARITPAGVVTEFPIESDLDPQGIAAGPDGNLWFTAVTLTSSGGRIGRVTPAGVITYFDTGTDVYPAGIAMSADGRLWFADANYRVARIDTDGTITAFDAGRPGIPSRITTGPDGNLWITLYQGDRIARATTETRAIEFYNASLDHYFYSWLPDEIARLDAGIEIKGWQRTGLSFKVYVLEQPTSAAVCRYYIPPPYGDTHFFGRSTEECNSVRARFPNLVIEDWTFMQMFVPDAGACPADTVPIYRVYNNRSDINHRYTSDRSVRDAMVAKGWTAEGDGLDVVTMCGPA